MVKWKSGTMVSVVGLLVLGCGPSAPSAQPEIPEPEPAAGPLPGTNFSIVYVRNDSVRARDTRSGTDRVISGAIRSMVEILSIGQRSGVVRSTVDRGDVYLVAADDRSVPLPGGGGEYSFAWSADGNRLAFGVRSGGSSPVERGVWAVAGAGEPESVGCTAADRVHAWRGEDALIVGDAANVYTVGLAGCGTLATLPRQGKSGFAFAAGGGRLSFFRRTPQGNALFIANHDGSGAQRIADPQVNPRDVSWSPDGSKVALVIDSPRYAGRAHVAIHDVAAGRISFNDREQPLGVPNEHNACWAPDSRRVLFDRIFDRSDGVQSYQTRQKVIKTGSVEAVVFEELRREDSGVSSNPCRWLGNQHVLIASNDGLRVLNVDTRDDYVIEDAEAVLSVQVHD